MKRIVGLFALTPMLGGLLFGDWKIVTRTGGSTVTEYFKGTLIRTDYAPAYSTVMDYDHRRQINWRSDIQQYVVMEWPAGPGSVRQSGRVITIERKTTDTGGRKQMFGRTARHLVTRVTRSDSPETQIDGWYIDAPGLPRSKNGSGGTFAVLTVSDSGSNPTIPQIKVVNTGPVPEGLAVWQKITHSVVLGSGTAVNQETVSEVTDLVEGSLPDKLFQAPDGYQRVSSLPVARSHPPHTFAELVRAHWQMIEGWFSSVF